MIYKIFTLFLLIFSFGCANQKERQIPENIQELSNLTVFPVSENPKLTISIKKDVTYGDREEVLIGEIGDFVVDSLGRVFIADVQKQVVNVFDANGRFVAQLSRKGRGPEEFTYIKKLQIHDDLLYVADANFGIQRISIFSLKSLTGIKTISIGINNKKYLLPARAYPGIHDIFVKNNGTYFAQYVAHELVPSEKKWQSVDQKGFMYLLDSTGEIASEQLFEFKEAVLINKPIGLLSPIEPFYGIALKAISSDEAIFWADPEEFLIREHSPEGIYRKSFYYPIKKIPLTKETAVKAGVHEFYIQSMKFMELPSFWPVLKDMRIDNQDRIWVATTERDMGEYKWWVLNLDGELITNFIWPKNKSIQVVKNNYLYTLETDVNSGVQEIVRYRFEIN